MENRVALELKVADLDGKGQQLLSNAINNTSFIGAREMRPTMNPVLVEDNDCCITALQLADIGDNNALGIQISVAKVR